jgi:hypothetical protein
VVNPDTMLSTVWAAFTLVALRLLLRGFSARRAVGLVAICALSALTHGRGLPIIPLTVLAFALAWWRHRPPLRQAAVWAGAGLAVLVAGFAAYRLLLSGSGGGAAYGGEVSFKGEAFSLTKFVNFVWQFYLPKLPFQDVRIGPAYGYRQMFIERYMAGSFGSLEVQFSGDVYRSVQLLCGAGLAALAIALVACRRALRPRWDAFLLLAAVVVVAIGFLHLASYRAVAGGGMDPLIVGRYLMPLTPVFGLAIAFIVGSLRKSWQPYAAGLVLTVGLLLELGALGMTFARFYV